jgi:hypothetical protein
MLRDRCFLGSLESPCEGGHKQAIGDQSAPRLRLSVYNMKLHTRLYGTCSVWKDHKAGSSIRIRGFTISQRSLEILPGLKVMTVRIPEMAFALSI